MIGNHNLALDYAAMPDLALARCCAAGDGAAVRHMVVANNQRLFRAAWSILRNRDEAEDALQSAYAKALAAIGTFEGRSSLTTWLTRIAINEALGRKRAAKRRRAHLEEASVAVLDHYRDKLMQGSLTGASPDKAHARAELRQLMEKAIAALPEPFRIVFVLREIEALSVEEVAETLALKPATVKTRHLRARRKLQEALAPEVREALNGSFPFAGADCAALTERVVAAWRSSAGA